MHTTFNSVLREGGLDPADVRLLRHKDKTALKGRSPYDLWREDQQAFNLYQTLQKFTNRKVLSAPYWASFVVTKNERTMFVGIYSVEYKGYLSKDTQMPHNFVVDKAGSCDEYKLTLENMLTNYIGKLFIEWGLGYKAWIQRADNQNKRILELKK